MPMPACLSRHVPPLPVVSAVLLALPPHVSTATRPVASSPSGVVAARINDNRVAAGVLGPTGLTLRLVASLAEWRPDGDSAPGAVVPAFGEEGRAPSIPGPLVRVAAGTTVSLTVRNGLPDATLAVHGLQSRVPGARPDSLVLAPGETRVVSMHLDRPGTYYYWGTTMGRAIDWRTGRDAQLTGAIVVDERGAKPPADRVMVLGLWTDTAGRVWMHRGQLLAVVNGRSWPHTERLDYGVGDTIRWRVINATADSHPMHLHGHYFEVESHGDGDEDSVYTAAERRLAVTDLLMPGTTMRLTWVPERAGNWLFHCHLPDHFEARGPLGVGRAAEPPPMADGTPMNHALSGMGGLVVGVRVHPDAGRKTAVRSAERMPRRALRLLVRPRTGGGGTVEEPLYEFAQSTPGAVDPADTSAHAAPAIVLTRGEPVAITVVNQLAVPTAVHWHGIELESYFDGVAGFSGMGARLTPVIAPGDSFEARFTPPRAGTFIYHTHVDEERQEPAGLAGPLIVVDPGATHDTATDLSILITAPRSWDEERDHVLVNGRMQPAALSLVAGRTYRLRLVNMTMHRPNGRFELRRDRTLVRWRDLARDGADLPAARQVERTAKEVVSIGQTLDVVITPDAPGELQLLVRAGPFAVDGPILATVPIRVRAAP